MASIAEEHKAELDLINLPGCFQGLNELISYVFFLMQCWSNCRALGIKLREADDFPYYETVGFQPELVELNNRHCLLNPAGGQDRDAKGNPISSCVCEAVINREFDPGLPYFTENGSFWTNSTSEFLKDRGGVRHRQKIQNMCNLWHFESASLIPIIYRDIVLGLLQFNDYRKGLFDPETIELLEGLASRLAIKIAPNFDLTNSREEKD